MLFNSIEFLFFFLPITIGVYYLLPFRFGLKNYWLLFVSLLFYAWGEPTFVLVLVGSIMANYLFALFIDMSRAKAKVAKTLLWLSIIGNLAILGVWKYANFITANLRSIFPSWQGAIPQTSILLPLGISFFTFQAISYVADVYRGTVKVQRNPFKVALYIALFPRLIAGPIVRYATVCDQIDCREHSWDKFSSGVVRFLIGFNKKMLISNLIAVAADKMFATAHLSVFGAWLGAISYTFQIYFDFSGYSDMAIGLGKMFGFDIPENFNYPYISKSCTEFWRRWHMTLGSWFRDYVYFPLGGSRVGNVRLVFNLFVVWLLTGIWHGANWTFILWGVLYGVVITFEKLTGLAKMLETGTAWRWLWQPFTILMVVLGWVLFRSHDISIAAGHIGEMFGFSSVGLIDDVAIFEALEIKIVLLIAVIGSVPWVSWLHGLLKDRMTKTWNVGVSLGAVLQLLLFLVGLSQLAMNAHNPFVYINF